MVIPSLIRISIFIQEAGIPMAMAGLLTALKETDLWHRLKTEEPVACGIEWK